MTTQETVGAAHSPAMELARFTHVLGHQCGVISRSQLLDLGAGDTDIRRWQRQRVLRRVHPGVYVDHTGPLTWEQRAWAAVLSHWPAALAHVSCLQQDRDVIHVAVDTSRHARSTRQVLVHRITGLEGRAMWNLAPPRLRLEDAALSVCARYEDRVRALALVTERAHGLPPADRQRRERTEDGIVYRDAPYLRLGWRHCEDTPCRTAARLARVLQSRGWPGEPRACSPRCEIS